MCYEYEVRYFFLRLICLFRSFFSLSWTCKREGVFCTVLFPYVFPLLGGVLFQDFSGVLLYELLFMRCYSYLVRRQFFSFYLYEFAILLVSLFHTLLPRHLYLSVGCTIRTDTGCAEC